MVVISKMLRMARSKFQIFKSVVISDSILMVDNLLGTKVSPKVSLHNQPMFSDVAVIIGPRVIGGFNQDVPVSKDATTFPPRMVAKRSMFKRAALAGGTIDALCICATVLATKSHAHIISGEWLNV